MTPLTVLHESPVVGDDIRWVVCKDGETFSVRKVKKGIQEIQQSNIKTLSHAKQIVESKVQMWRAFAGKK